MSYIRIILSGVVNFLTRGSTSGINVSFCTFSYPKDGDTKVSILNWQLSSINSPALHLGYFLYMNCSEAQLSKFDKLIGFYHDHLSKNMKGYGCDPDRILPLEKLLEHWDKAAFFGVCFVCAGLEMMLVEVEDIVDFNGADEDKKKEWYQTVKVKDLDLFRERVCAVGRHYFKKINRI